jgi:hypothetical protein
LPSKYNEIKNITLGLSQLNFDLEFQLRKRCSRLKKTKIKKKLCHNFTLASQMILPMLRLAFKRFETPFNKGVGEQRCQIFFATGRHHNVAIAIPFSNTRNKPYLTKYVLIYMGSFNAIHQVKPT